MEIQPTLLLPALASLFFFLWCLTKFLRGNKNPPPSPWGLPIIGNLHQLGSLMHLSLELLAKKLGPLMLLHFGSTPVLVVSSAEAAREIIKNHDLNFSERPLSKAMDRAVYGGKDVVFSPYGDEWKQRRGMFVVKFLSPQKVRSFRPIREEETERLMRKVRESPGPVNLNELFFEFAAHVISRSAFGRKYSYSEKLKEFIMMVQELTELMGVICVGDYIPWLSLVDRFSGFDARLEAVARGLDEFIEGVIEDRLQIEEQVHDADNFLDIMIEMYKDKSGDPEASIEKDVIKAVILDVFAAGIDAAPVVLEWAMAELLANPIIMQKLQREVRDIVQQNSVITEEDLEKMHYLKAVIKETFRFHPPVPLLLPRKTREDVILNGYNISAGTTVMTNFWAIGRDPKYWEEPEKFEPNRFLNSKADYRGVTSDFMPFGTGRRSCPGITYSVTGIEFLLANLVREFNWKLPDGDELDMSVKAGATLHKLVPLVAVATKTM